MPGDQKKDYMLEEIRSLKASVKEIASKVGEVDKTLVEYKAAFDHHLITDEKMYEELKRMNDILSINTESLRTHIRRTELLEQATVKLDGRLTELEVKDIEKKAINKWLKDKIILGAKILGALVALATLAAMVPSFLQWLIR